MRVIDLAEIDTLIPEISGADVEAVPEFGEDPGVSALTSFFILSVEHFRHVARIFHFHSRNNVALHNNFNSIAFRLDLISTITCKKIGLAIRILGLLSQVGLGET